VYASNGAGRNVFKNINSSYNGQNGIYISGTTSTRNNITASSLQFNGLSGVKLEIGGSNIIKSTTSCYNNQAAKDINCTSSTGNSGTGNNFNSVQACGDNNWPVLGVDYTAC